MDPTAGQRNPVDNDPGDQRGPEKGQPEVGFEVVFRARVPTHNIGRILRTLAELSAYLELDQFSVQPRSDLTACEDAYRRVTREHREYRQRCAELNIEAMDLTDWIVDRARWGVNGEAAIAMARADVAPIDVLGPKPKSKKRA